MEINKLNKIKSILKKGGIIIFPTETVYGIGVDPFIRESIKKIYRIKNREKRKPLTLHLSDASYIYKFAKVNNVTRLIIEKFLPGPITIILPKKRNIPRYIVSGKKKVGFRVPNCEIAREIIKFYGKPIAATSVNISGNHPINNLDEIREKFGEVVDYIVDEPCNLSKISSTILDLTHKPFKVIREGEVKIEEINRLLKEVHKI